MNTIAVDDVVRGDLLLVTGKCGNALADLILELDGSPDRYSHAGLALGDGRIFSALMRFEGFDRPWPPDLGGRSIDPFSHFWDNRQEIHRLRVDPGDRARACERLDEFLTTDGSFSVPKIVMVAAALHALSPRNSLCDEARSRVVESAIVAARAWCGDGDYYCAELVAQVYDWTFTLDELIPPRQYFAMPMALARLAVRGAEKLLTLGRCEQQRVTLHAFVAEVLASDPDFFTEHLQDVLDVALGQAPEEVRKGAEAVRRERLADVRLSLDGDTALPWPLVTPRMLAARHRGGDHLPTVVRDAGATTRA